MGKKEGIVIEFTNEEMEQYVHKLYMHDGFNACDMETPYNTCVFIEDVILAKMPWWS